MQLRPVVSLNKSPTNESSGKRTNRFSSHPVEKEQNKEEYSSDSFEEDAEEDSKKPPVPAGRDKEGEEGIAYHPDPEPNRR